MKQIRKKYLLANRDNITHICLEKVPLYFHSELIPHAKYFTDIDENGIILDQQIWFKDFQIYYHLVHLEGDTKLTTVTTDKDIVAACISGFHGHSPAFPMKITLPAKGYILQYPATEFVIDFHVNFDSFYLYSIIGAHPLFKILNPKVEFNVYEIHAFNSPSHPYLTNKINYTIMQRIINCKLVNDAAVVYHYRNAVNFFYTYLHYLQTPAPIMLHDQYTSKLDAIADYIIQFPGEDKNKETLCRKFDVVPEFLEEPFLQQFYIPVDDLIYQERMNLAFKLLTEQQHTLTYVANKTGFESHEEMQKAFTVYYRCHFETFLNLQ